MAKSQKETVEKAKADQKDQKKQVCNDTGPFSVDQMSSLIGLMKKNDLTEFELQNGDFKIHLKRGVDCAAQPPVFAASAFPMAGAHALAPASPVAAPELEKTETDSVFIKEITSPMVGTFYVSSAPNKPPFVSVGDVIGSDKTVCIIEAMKVFNEIKGEVSGKIVAVLVKDGEAVEFGRPLFKVDTRG